MKQLTEEARLLLSRWSFWMRWGAIAATVFLALLWAAYGFPVFIIFLEVGVQRMNESETGAFFFFALLGGGVMGLATTAVVRLWQASAALSRAHHSTPDLEASGRHLASFWGFVLAAFGAGCFGLICLFLFAIS